MDNDLLELLCSVANGTLRGQVIRVSPQAATTVMLVSGGYPGSYEKGKPIEGLNATSDCIIFHAGTAKKDDRIVTAGGRVNAITALADDMKAALAKSNANAKIICFEGKYFRKDIGAEFKV